MFWRLDCEAFEGVVFVRYEFKNDWVVEWSAHWWIKVRIIAAEQLDYQIFMWRDQISSGRVGR